MNFRKACKKAAHAVFLVLTLPAAILAGFGRFRTGFAFGAQWMSLMPGLPGDYLRIAYYYWTLEDCSLESRVSFGTTFAHPEASVGPGVYIGQGCILGRCRIGARSQIASQVQILSGRRQHHRGPGGQIGGAETGTFTRVDIGDDCWIGAAAIVMETVGDRSTVGAGAVVTRPVAPGMVVVGNPARPRSGDSGGH